jgi:hypothetical protein
MDRATILHEAERCVCTDRETQYGSPEDNFSLIAQLWELYIKRKCVSFSADVCILPEDVGCMMALLKIARIASGQIKDDNYVDGCGYLACAGELANE